ncbi:MAG: plasmid mobilization relaxosome protein MobC [Propionibacteriales bacterium]|nr:plasmid mobilization relaxosome protein MobC [Propionibacteriales bacterium]
MTDKPTPKRQLARRRRANVAGGRKHRHEVLVTEFEEARLVQLAEAQRVTVPRLLIESALAAQGETSTQRRRAMAELFAIRRALAGTVNNVNQIARVANAEGRVSDELAATLGELDVRLHAIDAAIDGLAG